MEAVVVSSGTPAKRPQMLFRTVFVFVSYKDTINVLVYVLCVLLVSSLQFER